MAFSMDSSPRAAPHVVNEQPEHFERGETDPAMAMSPNASNFTSPAPDALTSQRTTALTSNTDPYDTLFDQCFDWQSYIEGVSSPSLRDLEHPVPQLTSHEEEPAPDISWSEEGDRIAFANGGDSTAQAEHTFGPDLLDGHGPQSSPHPEEAVAPGPLEENRNEADESIRHAYGGDGTAYLEHTFGPGVPDSGIHGDTSMWYMPSAHVIAGPMPAGPMSDPYQIGPEQFGNPPYEAPGEAHWQGGEGVGMLRLSQHRPEGVFQALQRQVTATAQMFKDPALNDCPRCHRSFKKRSDLKHHARSHDPDKAKYKCESCPKAFRYPKDLTRHKETVHELLGRRAHSCGECGATFKRKDHLLRHRRKCPPPPTQGVSSQPAYSPYS